MSKLFAPTFRAFVKPTAAPVMASLAAPRAPLVCRSFHSSPARFEPDPITRPHLLPDFSLQDKVIVVSGGARGLGLVQAEALLEAGATVHCVDRLTTPLDDPTSHFSRVARRAEEELGATIKYHQIDVRNVPQLNETFTAIADEGGRLDGLIAAAGINFETPALDYTVQETERMLSINVTGCFMTAQAAARQMVRLKNPGSICMIASMSGTIANRGMFAPVYNASKSAVLQLSRSLAAEWGEHGIRVNTLSPGYIQTEMLQNLFDVYPERKAKWASENMLGRISDPSEFRGPAVFFMSDASSFMTGADIRIDGGHTAW